MVEHCGGPKTDGDYVHTLTMTDIATGWTECVAMRMREQMLIVAAFDQVAAVLPFAMLGVDSDNDSAFMSESVFDYCKGHDLVQTRSRAYKKNDQAWVEQKNGSIVRRLVGYGPPERGRSDEGPGNAVRVISPVRKLLPAIVQTEIQDTRWRQGTQDLLHTGDPLRPGSGSRQHCADDQAAAEGAVRKPRPGAVAARYPEGAADAE